MALLSLVSSRIKYSASSSSNNISHLIASYNCERRFHIYNNWHKIIENTFNKWEKEHAEWAKIVDEAPTLLEFLTNKYAPK